MRYLASFRDDLGKQHGKIFARKKEAEQFLTKTVRSVDDGTYTNVRPVLMGEVFDRWVANCLVPGEQLGRIKLSTAIVSQSILKKHLRPAFGQYRSDRLTADIITNWTNALAQQVAAGAMARKTFNNVVGRFKCIVKWARQPAQRFMKHDPTAHVQRLERDRREREILQPHELAVLLEEAQRDVMDGTIVKTYALTGLRRGELFGLQWSDLQVNSSRAGGRLHIRRAIVCGQVTTPKSRAGERMIDIPQCLVDELMIYSALYPPIGLGWIFRTEKGGFLDPHNWYSRNFIPICQRAGLQQIGLHVLRHGYITYLLEQGASIKYAQRQAGHSTASMTLDVYGHLLHESGAVAMQRLDDRFAVNSKLTRLALPASNTVQDEHVSEPVKLLENHNGSDLGRTPAKKVKVSR